MAKIMTYNLRVNVASDGKNSFTNRQGKIIEFLSKEKPDIIGFQEATDDMRAWLRQNLTDYTVVGCGRCKDYTGEGTPIAFLTDKYELTELKTFWLSSTPSVPASRYGADQSGCPRVTVAVRLKPHGDSEPFWFINTHLDHEGETARRLGASQLLQFVSSLDGNCIITGDFNAPPEESSIKALVEDPECKLFDCTEKIKGSFHAFRDISEEEMIKIDYIFTDFAKYGEAVLYSDSPSDGVFLSDHRPISVEIEI